MSPEFATPPVAVVTIVRNRLEHLAAQRWGLARQSCRPDCHVVVWMGGADPSVTLDDEPIRTRLVPFPTEHPLPLAAARNAGFTVAAESTDQVVIFLDVDCIPDSALVARYVQAGTRHDALLAGPVHYLGPDDRAAAPRSPRSWSTVTRGAQPHPARPVPRGDELLVEHRYELFWSLSFALRAGTFRELGGFHEEYVGYGGEDTDLAFSARANGTPFMWVGGADAYHQWHPTHDPPVQHVDSIVANAHVFWRRWHVWPMQGWLRQFTELGLIQWGTDGPCVAPDR